MTVQNPSAVRLAMRYVIPLQPGQADTVRQRVKEIGASFNALPGLVAKLFLLADDATPTYSLFYIWEAPGAMQAFLDGERFAAVTAKYGRPAVTTFLTTDSGIDLHPGEALSIASEGSASVDAVNTFQDPMTGRAVLLTRSAEGRHEVLFVAKPETTHA